MMPLFAGLDAAVALVRRFRVLIVAAPFALLSAFLWAKLYGFLWWDGAIEQRDKARAAVAMCQEAGQRNLAEQIRQRDLEKAAYQANHEKAKQIHAKELEAAHDGLDRFIERNRLHQNGLRGGSSGGAGQDQGAESRQEVPSGAIMVSETDLRICTDRTADAVATFEYFEGLRKDGLAE